MSHLEKVIDDSQKEGSPNRLKSYGSTAYSLHNAALNVSLPSYVRKYLFEQTIIYLAAAVEELKQPNSKAL